MVSLLGLAALTTAGPTVVGLAQILPTLVLAIGLVAGLLRLVWFVTSRRAS